MSLAPAALREFLFSEGDATLEVCGTSMIPSLKPGQRIKISRLHSKPLPGRIYIFKLNNELLAHRCISSSGSVVCFSGDGTLQTERVPLRNVLGCVQRRGNWFFANLIALVSRAKIVNRLGMALVLKTALVWCEDFICKGVKNEKTVH